VLCNANDKLKQILLQKRLVDFYYFGEAKSGSASNMACPLGPKKWAGNRLPIGSASSGSVPPLEAILG